MSKETDSAVKADVHARMVSQRVPTHVGFNPSPEDQAALSYLKAKYSLTNTAIMRLSVQYFAAEAGMKKGAKEA